MNGLAGLVTSMTENDPVLVSGMVGWLLSRPCAAT
jgi:hypothetical protein